LELGTRFKSSKEARAGLGRGSSEERPVDLTVTHAGELATCSAAGLGWGPAGVVEDGAFLVKGGKVAWVGTSKELSRRSFGKVRVIDAEGCLVTPGLVDPHTHLAFAGSREDEVELKSSGMTYKAILEEGGGIGRTVRETNAASTARIVRESSPRLAQLVRNGVTTVEVKTGYGQSVKGELKLLRAVAQLSRLSEAEVVTTFMGLHAAPPGFKSHSEYARFATREILPKAAEFAPKPSFSDCFCEEGIFSRDECLRYLRASKALGMACKVHADEFSYSGGAEVAAEAGCVSADHLGNSSRAGLRDMARNGVAAVLLPATSLFSGIGYADARMVSEAGCAIALGTDLSPNSWVESPQLVMSLACSALRMTPAEALLGFTRNAAVALGRTDIGSIEAGKSADFVIHEVPRHMFLPYRVGGSYVRQVFRKGRELSLGP
jgi:imidazolonepropionase